MANVDWYVCPALCALATVGTPPSQRPRVVWAPCRDSVYIQVCSAPGGAPAVGDAGRRRGLVTLCVYPTGGVRVRVAYSARHLARRMPQSDQTPIDSSYLTSKADMALTLTVCSDGKALELLTKPTFGGDERASGRGRVIRCWRDFLFARSSRSCFRCSAAA